MNPKLESTPQFGVHALLVMYMYMLSDTVEPFLKDTPEIRTLCPKYCAFFQHKFTPEMRTPLYTGQVPKMSTVEGFHCIQDTYQVPKMSTVEGLGFHFIS